MTLTLASIFRPKKTAQAAALDALGVHSAEACMTAALMRRQPGEPPRLMSCRGFKGDAAFQDLARWRRRAGRQGTATHFLLSMGDYQIFPIDVPDLPSSELSQVARWKVKDMMDFPPEQASVACVLVPAVDQDSAPSRARQALVVVTRQATVAQWMARSRALKFSMQAIDIVELALRNVAALEAGDGAYGLLHVGLVRTTLVMVWKGELCSFRRFELTAGQLLAATALDRGALIERLALDLQRTSDAFERQFYSAVVRPMQVIEEIEGLTLAPLLSEYLSSPVVAFSMREHLHLEPDLPKALIDVEQGFDFIPAIGAALRNEAVAT